MQYEPTVEEYQKIKADLDALYEEQSKMVAENKDFIKSLGETAISDFEELMEYCTNPFSFKPEWVDEPMGNAQFEDSVGIFQEIHVDQWQNGGMTGDDFAGDIYANVNGRWLKIPYEM